MFIVFFYKSSIPLRLWKWSFLQLSLAGFAGMLQHNFPIVAIFSQSGLFFIVGSPLWTLAIVATVACISFQSGLWSSFNASIDFIEDSHHLSFAGSLKRRLSLMYHLEWTDSGLNNFLKKGKHTQLVSTWTHCLFLLFGDLNGLPVLRHHLRSSLVMAIPSMVLSLASPEPSLTRGWPFLAHDIVPYWSSLVQRWPGME